VARSYCSRGRGNLELLLAKRLQILPPEIENAEMAKDYWNTVPAIQGMPVNSAIGSPWDGETIKLSSDSIIEVKEYALPPPRSR